MSTHICVAEPRCVGFFNFYHIIIGVYCIIIVSYCYWIFSVLLLIIIGYYTLILSVIDIICDVLQGQELALLCFVRGIEV